MTSTNCPQPPLVIAAFHPSVDSFLMVTSGTYRWQYTECTRPNATIYCEKSMAHSFTSW